MSYQIEVADTFFTTGFYINQVKHFLKGVLSYNILLVKFQNHLYLEINLQLEHRLADLNHSLNETHRSL